MRITKYISIVFASFLALSSLIACRDKGPESPDNGGGNNNGKFIITGVAIPSSISVVYGEDYTFSFSGSGPSDGDELVFIDNKSSKELSLKIKDATDNSFAVNISEALSSGEYTVKIRRGETSYTVSSSTRVTVTIKVDITPKSTTTVYGAILCGVKPVAGVAVSDGYEVTTTDSRGVYELNSEKKNGYVFVSVPSGYKVVTKGVQPIFWKTTSARANKAERIDFELFDDGDQTDHTMLVFGDMHLAARTNDHNQFANFCSDVNEYIAANKNDKIYGLTLGDMTWDRYWYTNKYSFEEYLKDVAAIKGLPIYHTIGNHDHDMYFSGDWDTVTKYKELIGPNYYSFNIGKFHYIVLDNILCTNTSGKTPADRHYMEDINADNLEWLAKDLSLVGKDTPIVLSMHAPMYNQNGGTSLMNASTLKYYLDGYKVYVLTGHTHKMWTVSDDNITEHNSGAVCATWWWAGYYTPQLNLAQDGAPGGYRVASMKGDKMSSYYKGTGRAAEYQFRTYDRNAINIDAAEIAPSQPDKYNSCLTRYGAYNTSSTANLVLINIWDYNSDWKISVTEKETGKTLNATRASLFDPLFLVAYCGKRFAAGASDITFSPFATNHMFRVNASSATSTLEISVTDDEGRTYTETMTRPKKFSLDTYK